MFTNSTIIHILFHFLISMPSTFPFKYICSSIISITTSPHFNLKLLCCRLLIGTNAFISSRVFSTIEKSFPKLGNG